MRLTNHKVNGVREARRIHRELTPEEQARLQKERAQIAEELPQLIERGQRAKIAAEEETFSGELRRRIHKSGMPISHIAKQCNVDVMELDEFLTGDKTLSSEVINRLVETLGCKLVLIK